MTHLPVYGNHGEGQDRADDKNSLQVATCLTPGGTEQPLVAHVEEQAKRHVQYGRAQITNGQRQEETVGDRLQRFVT